MEQPKVQVRPSVAGGFALSCDGYTIECTPSGLPLVYDNLKAHASLVEEFELQQGAVCCLTVKRAGERWPFLVVAQSYAPHGGGFDPGALLAADTKVLFIGAGERVLAYQLEAPARLWEDRADTGFHSWERHGDTVLLAAELEFAAWSTAGAKRWTTFVEPPWDYVVTGDTIELDVMGKKRRFKLRDGP